MAAEQNFFHRWRGMTTIGYELGVIWEMSAKKLGAIYHQSTNLLYCPN